MTHNDPRVRKPQGGIDLEGGRKGKKMPVLFLFFFLNFWPEVRGNGLPTIS